MACKKQATGQRTTTGRGNPDFRIIWHLPLSAFPPELNAGFPKQTEPMQPSHRELTAARVDRSVMALLQAAETQATALIDAHRDQIRMLVARLEAEETLDLVQIRECLDEDRKVRPFVAPGKAADPETAR